LETPSLCSCRRAPPESLDSRESAFSLRQDREGGGVGTLRLHGGSLRDVDLRGLEMRTVSGVGSLAGATVSSGQLSELAPLLAQHLGLRVTDQDHAQNVTTRSRRA